MATQSPTGAHVNGVDTDRLSELLDQARRQPGTARFKLRAHNRWVDGAHARTEVRDYSHDGQERQHGQPFVFEADEPDVLLGTDRGPNATELLLVALSNCLNTTFIYHAAARGVEIEELRLELEGDLDVRGIFGVDPGVRNGFSEIRVTFHVRSRASDEQIQELCRVARERSPVFDMVTNKTTVTARCERA